MGVPGGDLGVGGVGGVWECGGISEGPRVTCCTWISPKRIFPALFHQFCACSTPFALENPRVKGSPQELVWVSLEKAGKGCSGTRG